jgi:hypothetical protein
VLEYLVSSEATPGSWSHCITAASHLPLLDIRGSMLESCRPSYDLKMVQSLPIHSAGNFYSKPVFRISIDLNTDTDPAFEINTDLDPGLFITKIKEIFLFENFNFY